MPTYDYRCEICENTFEIFQSFSEEPLTDCPSDECSGEVRKIFSAPGISFKGSGFYKNDSRSKKASSNAETSTKSSESASTPDTSPKTEKPKSSDGVSSSSTNSAG